MIGLRFFPLKSADVRGEGTRDARLRTNAGEVGSVEGLTIGGPYIRSEICASKSNKSSSRKIPKINVATRPRATATGSSPRRRGVSRKR